jgi:hypothetical protein
VAAVTSFLEFITETRLSVLFLYYTTRVFTMNRLPWDDAGTGFNQQNKTKTN